MDDHSRGRLAALLDDPRWRWVAPTCLTLLAAVLLFARLDEPARIIFDETYYVNDAREYLDQGVEGSFAVHPPVGKWLIAAGIALLGDDAVGWRAVGALAGALTVLLTYLVGRRLFRSVGYAALAGLLLLTDGLFFVQARISMLDIHLALFVVLGAYLLLVDRDRSGLARRPPPALLAGEPGDGEVDARGSVADRAPVDRMAVDDAAVTHEAATDEAADAGAADAGAADAGAADAGAADAGAADAGAADERVTDQADNEAVADQPDRFGAASAVPFGSHGFRVLAGVAFGLAIATKWSGLLALGAAGLLTLGWELLLRRRWTGRWTARAVRMLASVLVALVLVPAGVYVASYVPWLVNYEHSHEGQKSCPEEAPASEPCQVDLTGRLAGLWRYQLAIARFHEGLEATHSYRAPALTWPVMARPVVYYWETCSEDRANGVPRTEDDGEVVEPEPCVVAQGEAAEILAVGNPVLWWGFLAATPMLVAALTRRRFPAAVIVLFYAAQFLPWLVVSRPVFFFYMVPVVPFLALGLAYATALLGERWPLAATYAGAAVGAGTAFGGALVVGSLSDLEVATARWIALGAGWLLGAVVGAWLDRRRRPLTAPRRERSPARPAAIVVGLLAVALFVYFLPVWTGVPLPEDTVKQRWWFDGWI